MDRLAQALAQFARLERLHPGSGLVWRDDGLLHARNRDFAGAADRLGRAAMLWYGDSVLARRWTTGLRDSAVGTTDVFDLVAAAGDLSWVRQRLTRASLAPGDFDPSDIQVWLREPDVRQLPEFQAILRRLNLPLMP